MVLTLRVMFPSPFENMRASTASHAENKCSTYTRYACGTFLPNPLYLHHLFSKNRHYRTVQKCTRMYTSGQAIFKSAGDTVHLLRHTVKKCPQCIKDTPVVLFCLTPCICSAYLQKGSYYITATDGGGSMQMRCFELCSKLEVNDCTRMYSL